MGGGDGIAARWSALRDDVADAAVRAGRAPAEVRIVAVSKGHDGAAIREAHGAGARAFGESYAQDWREKWELGLDGLEWHWLGRLQSNKVKEVAEHAHWVHSVSRGKTLRELAKRGFGGAVLLQVDISGEASKGGVAPDELAALLDTAGELGLDVRGLMGMAPLEGGETAARRAFARLAALRAEHRRSWPGLVELSMGMSGDWQAAIDEGATILRIGTRIFGPRGSVR